MERVYGQAYFSRRGEVQLIEGRQGDGNHLPLGPT